MATINLIYPYTWPSNPQMSSGCIAIDFQASPGARLSGVSLQYPNAPAMIAAFVPTPDPADPDHYFLVVALQYPRPLAAGAFPTTGDLTITVTDTGPQPNSATTIVTIVYGPPHP